MYPSLFYALKDQVGAAELAKSREQGINLRKKLTNRITETILGAPIAHDKAREYKVPVFLSAPI